MAKQKKSPIIKEEQQTKQKRGQKMDNVRISQPSSKKGD
jgi:hypothetical protein